VLGIDRASIDPQGVEKDAMLGGNLAKLYDIKMPATA
jgi:hypothetical protein